MLGFLSIRVAYRVWLRASLVSLLAWVADLSFGDSWLVNIGLGIVLIALLVGGVALLIAGTVTLIRDARRYFRESDKDETGRHAAD
jgi:hypothetical protein